jgi:16S rRNA (uracil1498-N3)-methyltransferase
MREHRLYTSQQLEVGTELALEPRPARHAAKVLRLGPGDPVTLFNGDGHDYPAQVVLCAKDAVRVRAVSVSPAEPAPPLAIRLALGISRGERMDLALQKAVELGVETIQPLFTKRVLVRLGGDRLAKRIEHWRGVIIAACEQSGRRRLPQLATANGLDHWLADDHGGGILLHHGATRAMAELPAPEQQLTLLIGPEGGLAPEERDQALGQGFTAVRLGPRVLRTETAPLAAIAAIQTLWGDFAPTPTST